MVHEEGVEYTWWALICADDRWQIWAKLALIYEGWIGETVHARLFSLGQTNKIMNENERNKFPSPPPDIENNLYST